MYAIIQTGGKQYRVEKGMKLDVEKLPAEVGGDIQFPEVLFIGGDNGTPAKIGQPHVADANVTATVLKQFRGPKVIIFKKRSKKGYRKTQGHRQDLTQVEIKEIKG